MCPFTTHREEYFTLHLDLLFCVEAGQPNGDEFGCEVFTLLNVLTHGFNTKIFLAYTPVAMGCGRILDLEPHRHLLSTCTTCYYNMPICCAF